MESFHGILGECAGRVACFERGLWPALQQAFSSAERAFLFVAESVVSHAAARRLQQVSGGLGPAVTVFGSALRRSGKETSCAKPLCVIVCACHRLFWRVCSRASACVGLTTRADYCFSCNEFQYDSAKPVSPVRPTCQVHMARCSCLSLSCWPYAGMHNQGSSCVSRNAQQLSPNTWHQFTRRVVD